MVETDRLRRQLKTVHAYAVTPFRADDLLAIDREGFEASMAQQKEKARSAWSGSGDAALSPVYRGLLDASGVTRFDGYDTLEADAVAQASVSHIPRGSPLPVIPAQAGSSF